MAMASDTLSISKDLRAAGLTEQQADLLATHIASRPDDLVTKQDLALAVAELERRIDRVDVRIDQVEAKVDRIVPQLLLRLGAGMVAGFGLMLTAMGIAVGVLLGQPG